MINITWYVDDGYANPGPQSLEIEEEDIFEDDMTEAEKQEAIEEVVKEEFMMKINWYIGDIKYD